MASVNQSIGFLEDSLVNSECGRDEQHNERVSRMIQLVKEGHVLTQDEKRGIVSSRKNSRMRRLRRVKKEKLEAFLQGPDAFKANRIGDRTLYNWADGGTVLTTLKGLGSEYVLFTPLNIMSPSSVEMISAMYDFSQEVALFRTGGARWDFPGSSVNVGELFAFVNEVDLRVDIFRVDGILDSETGRRVHWNIFGHDTRNVAVLSPYIGRMSFGDWKTFVPTKALGTMRRKIKRLKTRSQIARPRLKTFSLD
ncbi:unnamed protein product [Ectocarpus sp. 12 AP-2014]